MKQYPRTFSDHSSYGSALRLLDAAGIADGVVLDLGCGRSPLAEPLAERGLTHVGCDVDTAALADLAERGSETHEVSLLATEDELLARLTEVLAGRPPRRGAGPRRARAPARARRRPCSPCAVWSSIRARRHRWS